jgi:2-polyprenyl-3-methyl-5-hydroxy-6-metoxy-1,4-benzoquinol methylase
MDGQQHDKSLSAGYGKRMGGSTTSQEAEHVDRLRRLGVGSHPGGHGLDLGCGTGDQSLALSRLGYWVTAIDSSRQRLDELERRRQGVDVQTVLGDLRQFRELRLPPMDVVLCMGDALTRLDDRDDLVRLFADLAMQIKLDGRLILSFRDLTDTRTGPANLISGRWGAFRKLRLSAAEVTTLLSAAGFAVQGEERIGPMVTLAATPVPSLIPVATEI